MQGRARRSLSLLGATMILGQCLGSFGWAQSASYRFDIVNQNLSQALRTFAQVSGQDIVFTEDLVVGRKSSLTGTYTAETALRQLLQGTGLRAVRSSSGALMIVRDTTGIIAPDSAEAGDSKHVKED